MNARTRLEGDLINYLKATVQVRKSIPGPKGYEYGSFEEFVLINGRVYESKALTKKEHSYVTRAARACGIKFQIKQCFFNAQMMLSSDAEKRLKYVEGYCYGSIIPVLHGWLTINGKVIDTTMRADGVREDPLFGANILGTFPENRAYFGITFPRKEVMKNMIETKFAGSMIDNEGRSYPFLKATPSWLCRR